MPEILNCGPVGLIDLDTPQHRPFMRKVEAAISEAIRKWAREDYLRQTPGQWLRSFFGTQVGLLRQLRELLPLWISGLRDRVFSSTPRVAR